MQLSTISSYHFYLFIGLALAFQACSQEPILESISEERWSIKQVGDAFEKDTIDFMESYHYNMDGILEGHVFYNLDGSVRAKELSLFSDDKNQAVGSQFMDAQDQLLSYYSFEYKEGLKQTAKAYDANSKELLRIEKYAYDEHQNLQSKVIQDANGSTVRSYLYYYDKEGNEEEVHVLDADGNTILTEHFDIKAVDKQGRWTQKWGFVDDKPFSFRTRKIKYQNL